MGAPSVSRTRGLHVHAADVHAKRHRLRLCKQVAVHVAAHELERSGITVQLIHAERGAIVLEHRERRVSIRRRVALGKLVCVRVDIAVGAGVVELQCARVA